MQDHVKHCGNIFFCHRTGNGLLFQNLVAVVVFFCLFVFLSMIESIQGPDAVQNMFPL